MPAAASEPAEFLQIASVQDVDGHIGVVADIEATLRLVGGEVHGNGGSDDVRVFADELLGHETAFAGVPVGLLHGLPSVGSFLSNT